MPTLDIGGTRLHYTDDGNSDETIVFRMACFSVVRCSLISSNT